MKRDVLRTIGKGAASALALGLSLVYGEGRAAANGRFPQAQIVVLPGGDDGHTLYLRASFGILKSTDGGRSFQWICEQAMGFEGTYDPPLAVLPDGRLFAGLTDGIRVTADACTFDDVPALKGELVTDLTIDRTQKRVFATVTTPGKPAFVYRSNPAGVFAKVSKGIAGMAFDTIEVARSNPNRVYVTGASSDGSSKVKAHLFRSDDGGATLKEMHPKLPVDGRLFVSSVDPVNPDRLLVREIHAEGSDVLVSEDGGQTFRLVLHTVGGLVGFAASADGQMVYAGSGLPSEGLYRSRDRGATWELAAKVKVRCLATDGPRLYVCSNPFAEKGFALGVSNDQGATVQPLSTFDDVKGPVVCDAGTAVACVSKWPELQASLVAAKPTETAAEAAPSATSAASSGALAIDGGTTSKADGRRCACGVVGQRSHDAMALFSVVGALSLTLRRRRR